MMHNEATTERLLKPSLDQIEQSGSLERGLASAYVLLRYLVWAARVWSYLGFKYFLDYI